MMVPIRFVALISLLGLAYGTAPSLAGSETIRIGTEGTDKPFSYTDASGNLTGFEIDLVRAICEKIDARCEFSTIAFDGIIPALQESRIDAIATKMRITEKRKKVVDFTDGYYSTNSQFMYCGTPKANGTSPEQMTGLTIGAQAGTSTGDYLEANYGKTSSLRLYKNFDEVLLDLGNGRLDFAAVSTFTGYDFKRTDAGKNCEFLGKPLSDPSLPSQIGMAVRKGDDDLRTSLNRGISAVMADGTYERINAKYFPFSIK